MLRNAFLVIVSAGGSRMLQNTTPIDLDTTRVVLTLRNIQKPQRSHVRWYFLLMNCINRLFNGMNQLNENFVLSFIEFSTTNSMIS